MPAVAFQPQLEIFQYPQTVTRLHDKILKSIVLAISFVPLLAFTLTYTIRVQEGSDSVCLFRHGGSGAIPCFAVNQLIFQEESRPIGLLLGPLISYAVEWQVTCLEEPVLGEESYRLMKSSELTGLKFGPPLSHKVKIYDYSQYSYDHFTVEAGTNCFISSVYLIKNLLLVEFLEFAILFGVATYYIVHFFLPGHNLPFVYSLLTFIVNLEVLGLAASMIIQLLITLILATYVKILNYRNQSALKGLHEAEKAIG